MPSIFLAVLASTVLAQSKPTFSHSPPAEAPVSQPLVIEGSLFGGSYSKLYLRVRGGEGGGYEDVLLELQYGDLFRGTVPASRMVPPGIEYYVEAPEADGSRTPIFATAAKPIRVMIKGTGPDLYADEAAVAPPPKPKCKKGKKCRDEEPAPPPPEPKKKDEKKDEWVDTTDAPAPVVKEKKEAPAPAPAPAPAAVQVRREEPAPPRQTRRQSELEEELAIYSAEAAGGVVQRIDERARVVPQTPTILDAHQLKQLGVRYVYEALDLVPGLSVSRDVQGFYRVAMRGLRSDAEVLITLNGQPLNNFYDGRSLAQLPIDNFERIEIFRGPATADVGLGNTTGVINLITRRDVGIRASASAGTWEMFDGHLNGAGTFGALTVFGDADVASQYGVRRRVLTDGLDTAGTRVKKTNDRRFLVNAGLGASLATDSIGTFDAQGRFMYEQRAALLGQFDAVGNDSSLNWVVGQAQLGWKKSVGDGHSLSIRALFDQQTTDRLFQLTPDAWTVSPGDQTTFFADGVLEQWKVGVRTIGLNARADFSLPFNNTLVAGLSVQHQSIFDFGVLANSVPGTNANAGSLVRPDGLRLPTEDGKGGRGPAADRLGFGVFLYDTWAPLDVLSIQAGLRFDLTQLPVADSLGSWTGSTFVPGIGPRIGATITPTKSLIFRGNYGRSFRAPTPQELAQAVPNNDFNQGRFIGNPNLQPAYIDAIELSGEYVQGIGEGKLRLIARGFFERISNAIVQIDTTGNLVPYANRPLGVQSVGAEGEARFEMSRRLAVWVNVSWVRAEDLTAPTQSRILTEVSQIRANAGASFPIGPYLNVDLVGRYASERRNNSRSVLELIRRYTLPANATMTAQLRTEPLFDHLEFMLLGQNVFNTEYADDATRPDRVTAGVPRETWQAFIQAKVGF